ncbi:MAG: hypothetical protein ABIJ20_02875 [Nanoarchaeota archaeon]|nr:hypothetical protein [Nanoarchaeota archaeon]MBU1445000.1 hypothetical protein [Nanoarchaeota archaeon]MBU2420710.1 hypothetical protein [Nanoarchaeota archaeon]MBU2475532.1 hypothetical protein [Nanoarchaeota archaeon]
MIQSELKNEYQDLFKKFDIDKKTGCLKNSPRIKFPTFPYVGSNYGNSKKILIVGLDIGSDEKIGGIQSFEERRQAIEEKPVSKHNPHIAGTYFTAIFFLKDDLNLQNYWNNLKNILSCQKALQYQEKLPPINPLSYIALTNYYKFVSINRKKRTGGENRIHQDQKIELNFFIEEVKIFNPNIIVFQSNSFKYKKFLLKRLLDMGKSIYIGPHPAYRGKREPDYFVKQILKVTTA